MKNINKLKNYLGTGGVVALLGITLVIVFLLKPLALIAGLNLLGFEVAYTFKTFLGAILVTSVMTINVNKKSK